MLDEPAWKSFKLDPKVRVRLDFRNASIDAVLQVISQASGVAIVKDPNLTGAITLQSPKPQSLADAFAMLTTALTLRNCDLSKQGNFLVIKQRAQMAAGRGFGGMSTAGSEAMANFMGGGATQTQTTLVVYPLKYASATQVAKVVTDVFTQTALDLMASGAIGGMGGGPGGMMGGGPSGMMGGGPGGMMGGGPGGMMGGGPGGMMGGGPGGMMGGGPGGMMGGMGAAGTRRTGSTTAVVKASADEYSNSVIVTAPSKVHEQIAKLVADLDKKTDQPQSSRVFPLQYANASDLVTVIQNVLTNNANTGRGSTGTRTTSSGGGFPMPFGFGSSSSSSSNAVVAETRTNSIVVTAIPDILTIVEQVVKQLDKPVTFENSAFVVTLANAKADLVAQLLNQSFSSSRSAATSATSTNRTTGSTGSASRTTSSNSTPSLNSGSRAVAIEDPTGSAASETRAAALAQGGGMGMGMQFGGQGYGSTSGSRSSASSSTASGYDSTGKVVNVRNLSGDLVAIADTNTNSVIVVTSPQNRKVIEDIIDQLDRIPEQVMIETIIVEASLDAADKLGVEWNFAGGSSSATSAFGLKSDTTQPQGLRYTLSAAQYGAFMQAVKTDSRFEVLSTPRIFTSNNAAAEINISQSLPYVTNSRVDSNGNYSYSYSFLDVGIVLSVTPRITSNGYVTMDVTQTANDFVRYTDFNAPVVNQREAQTTVSVKDGETVVLGGIIKNSVSATTNKVPLLGDIPLLGHLFRSTSKTTSKTELLVFLTPKVVKDPDEARRLREETQAQMQSKTLDRLLKSGGVSRSFAQDDPAVSGPVKPAEGQPAKR